MNNPSPPDHTVSHLRGIRSFVLRQGHLSASQLNAINTLMPRWGMAYRAEHTDLNALFGRDKPKILEIGFGMGTATAEIAHQLPEYDFVAIDVHSPGVGNLLKLINERGIDNIRVMRHDAVEVVTHMLGDGSLHGVHIFFPDPWHKKRHHKRRLIQPDFINKLLPKIAIGGYVHAATDWQDYAEQMLEVLSATAGLRNTAADYAPKPAYRPETKFETRGKKLGHGVWDLVFERI
ncbi:MAG: tRNA (guanosine(46)-N7)-methyltransferase TrmB [Neisseria sp.]|nr:tRNA (guanosine(46)-N7)-methyltransferase TrmB [Neisseria sp.]